MLRFQMKEGEQLHSWWTAAQNIKKVVSATRPKVLELKTIQQPKA